MKSGNDNVVIDKLKRNSIKLKNYFAFNCSTKQSEYIVILPIDSSQAIYVRGHYSISLLKFKIQTPHIESAHIDKHSNHTNIRSHEYCRFEK